VFLKCEYSNAQINAVGYSFTRTPMRKLSYAHLKTKIKFRLLYEIYLP